MKIVFLSSLGQLGGAERVLLDIISSLRVARPLWSLHVIAASEGALLEDARSLGASAELIKFPGRLARLGDARRGDSHPLLSQFLLFPQVAAAGAGCLSYALRLRSALAGLAPDLVHANGHKMHLLGRWAKPSSAPLVWHIHDYVSYRPLMSWLLKYHVGRDVMAVANSQSVAHDIVDVCGSDLRVATVYNAVDLDRFHPAGARLDLDALAGMPAAPRGTIRAGLVATLSLWKGHETFLKALSLLPRDLPLRGYIIGDAIYQTRGSQHSLENLRRLAARLGLKGKVGFTGFVHEVPEAMRALDIMVHASTLPEPFGLVIVEAMACGRAVIASLSGGAKEIVAAGEDALVHSPGDARALAECLRRLSADAGLRERLGSAGRRSAERRFGRARLASELVPIYEAARRRVA